MSAPIPLQRGSGGTATPLLEVDDLHVEFRTPHGVVRAVNGVSWSLEAGSTLAILGESGSGKSVTAQAIMGILDSPPAYVTGGAIRYRGEDLLTLPPGNRRRLRGAKIAMVFQDALSALNPVQPVGYQIAEMFRVHQRMGRRQSLARAVELMDRVRIPAAAKRVHDYPHQLSGGMRQRIVIAMAIALSPDVLLADEPTTALDVTVQAQILALLAELQAEMQMGLVLITHDLGVVAEVADRIAVMYAGRIVESAAVGELYARPAHPYTEALLASVPRVDGREHADGNGRLPAIPGQPPSLAAIPTGCTFAPRCSRRREEPCTTEEPPLYEVAEGRGSRCHFFAEVLPAPPADVPLTPEEVR